MKLELKEINITEESLSENPMNNFKSFDDILDCFERQDNFFKSLEKEFILPTIYQILFIFCFLLLIPVSFSFLLLSIKFSIAYFSQKFIKKSKLEFPFSAFFYSVFSFSSSKNKTANNKIWIYQEEKRRFLADFFSFPINKEIIFQYLHKFYQDNEYRLSSNIYTEIDTIKSLIEKESYESAFEKILYFKKIIKYIDNFNQIEK